MNKDDTSANNSTERVSFRLLQDLPTSDDAFGAHERLADAVADLVSTEDGGKAIALEGGWGSGKSSVIEMLKERLNRRNPGEGSIRVHVFDAWSHDGDPLRRVFLEELTEFCSFEFDEETKRQWEKRKKTEITGRTRETEQTTTPVLRSRWPILALVGAALYPVALIALGAYLRWTTIGWWHVGCIVLLSLIAVAPAVGLSLIFLQCKNDSPKQLKKAGQWIFAMGQKGL